MLKKIMVFTMFLYVVLLMSGCTKPVEEETSTHLVIVSGYTRNSVPPNFDSETVRNLISEAISSYGSVTIIVDDGRPYVAGNFLITRSKKSLTNSKKEQIREGQVSEIIQVLKTAKAKSEEVDTLTAVSYAARAFNIHDGENQSLKLLVLDSGLATTGYVNFSQNLFRIEDMQILVNYLKETQALPELNGVEAIWIGAGEVSGEQEELTPSDKKLVKDAWYKILFSSGAVSVKFEDVLESSCNDDELPYVTPVTITRDLPLQISNDDVLKYPIIIDENKILFKPDSTEFQNQEKAVQAIKPLAEYMMSHPTLSIGLAGTTASVGDNSSCREFSFRRAQAVKELFVTLGVPENQISGVVGLGYDHPYHVPDINADGSLNANAQANRSVIIFDADSEEWKNLQVKYN